MQSFPKNFALFNLFFDWIWVDLSNVRIMSFRRGRQMTNLVTNFEYLLLLRFLTYFRNLGQGITIKSKEKILGKLDFFRI